MHALELAFWIFFGACALWVLYGFVRMFAFERRIPPPRPAAPQRGMAAGGAADSPGINSASAEMPDGVESAETSGDPGSSDSGSSDSGGGFESGGGESGGGGSSGGWN